MLNSETEWTVTKKIGSNRLESTRILNITLINGSRTQGQFADSQKILAWFSLVASNVMVFKRLTKDFPHSLTTYEKSIVAKFFLQVDTS